MIFGDTFSSFDSSTFNMRRSEDSEPKRKKKKKKKVGVERKLLLCCVFLNCFLRFPNWVFLDKQLIRIPKIISTLVQHKPDIIGLSEIFGKVHMNYMKTEFQKFGYTLLSPSSKHMTNSGLAFAIKRKRFIVISTTFIPFEYTTFPDILAAKGFFLVKLFHKKKKRSLTAIVTHFQASYNFGEKFGLFGKKMFEKIQIQQLLQLTSYLTRLKRDTHYILLGDFNIDIHEKTLPAHFFRRIFPQTKHMFETGTTSDGTNETLDYIISSLNMKHIEVIEKPIISDHFFVKGLLGE